METQHQKDTRDLDGHLMSTNALVLYTKATTSAVPAPAWMPPMMRGSLLYWEGLTVRDSFLILSQALPFLTSTLWSCLYYQHPFSYDVPSFSCLSFYWKKKKSGEGGYFLLHLCYRWLFISFSRISSSKLLPHQQISKNKDLNISYSFFFLVGAPSKTNQKEW